jgi:hypothetical protein
MTEGGTAMSKKNHRTDEISKEISSRSGLPNCDVDSLSDHIRARAYQLFEGRGRQPGRELDDWLQAERETKKHWGVQ